MDQEQQQQFLGMNIHDPGRLALLTVTTCIYAMADDLAPHSAAASLLITIAAAREENVT